MEANAAGGLELMKEVNLLKDKIKVLEQDRSTHNEDGGKQTDHRYRHKITTYVWVGILLAAVLVYCFQISDCFTNYAMNPKKVSVEVVTTDIPFPSISLCSMRNLDFEILNDIHRRFLKSPQPLDHINSSTDPFVKDYMNIVAKYSPLWYEYQEEYPRVFKEVFSRASIFDNINTDVLEKAGVKLKEFMVKCQFGTNACDFTQDFIQFFDQYYCNCFTYTPPSDEDKKELNEGMENGWSAVLFSGSGLLDKSETIRVLPGLMVSETSSGVRVVIHPPNTKPMPLTEGYDIPPGFAASFAIKPRLNTRLGPPHGNCLNENPFSAGAADDSPDSSTVAAGGNHHHGNSMQYQYRGITCKKQCLQSHVMRDCNCSDPALPATTTNNPVPSCRDDSEIPDSCKHEASRACLEVLFRLYERIECARRSASRVMESSALLRECGCFPPCEEVHYDVSYSLSKWPAAGIEGDAAWFDIFYIEEFKQRFGGSTSKWKDIDDYFNDSVRDERMGDFSRLNVYIAEADGIKTQETPDFTFANLMSCILGQLIVLIVIVVIAFTNIFDYYGCM